MTMPAGEIWFIYLIRRPDRALYTGITTDVERRFGEHRNGVKGAKALRGRGPLELVFSAPVGDRSLASRLEARIKRMPKTQKEALATGRADLNELIEGLQDD